MQLKRQKYLTEPEFKRLLYVVRTRPHRDTCRNYAIFTLAGLCGLRSVEVTTIQVGDCAKLKENPPRLDVRTAKQRAPKKFGGFSDGELSRLKGHTPIDEIAVPKTAAYALRKWLGKLPKYTPQERVFAIQTRQLRRLFRHYATIAGIPPTRSFHSLRHFRGVQLYTKYRDLILVKESLRHRQAATTEIYVAAVEAPEKQAACDIDLGGEEETNQVPTKQTAAQPTALTPLTGPWSGQKKTRQDDIELGGENETQ